jgi:beta-glucanase (GH16 family)
MISTVFICNAQLVDPQSPTNIKPDLNFENLPNSSKAENWDLVFSDEFNDTEMNPEKWNIQDDFSRLRNNDVLLDARTEDVEERDGKAYIYYSKDQSIEKKYYAGRFESKYKYAKTFGYFEVRMHIVEPFGHQTAFWMMPNQEGTTAPNNVIDGTAKDGAEIDIIEGNINSDTYSTGLHWDGYGADHKSKGLKIDANGLFTEEYHTYGFEWSPTFIKWYYDGELVRTETDSKFIALVDHHLYFTGSVFGESSTWVTKYIGNYDLLNNGGRDEAYIDWVRVYENKSLIIDPETLNANSIIMDSENSTGITISGDWTQSTFTSGFYGANYLHDQNSDSPKSVSYAPELSTIGDFEIFTRFAADENRSSQTKYEIITKVDDEQVIETVLVDQTINTGEWISLGIYRLSGLTFPKVIISNENADGYVIADAIAFSRQPTLSVENTVKLEKLIKIYTVNKEFIIQFNEEHSGSANIVVYNIYGKIIKTHKNVDLSQKNTKTTIGLYMSSGIYIVKLNIDGQSITKKIIFL